MRPGPHDARGAGQRASAGAWRPRSGETARGAPSPGGATRLRTRVTEGRVVRRRGKGRPAGGRAAGVLTHPATGVPQGGGRAPVLGTLCLHPVLEAGCERAGRPRMQGRGCVRRCAEDGVRGGEGDTAARRILAVLPQRCARGGRRRPPTQTALSACRKPAARPDTEDGTGPGDCLGLPPDWPPARRGGWVSTRQPGSKRRQRTTTSLWRWCRPTRHAPVNDPSQRRCLQWRGHVQDDARRGNCRMGEGIAHDAAPAWRYGLRRRRRTSGRGGEQCQTRRRVSPLPIPRLVHTSGSSLQGSTVRRQSGPETLVTEDPYACMAHVRVWGGAGWGTTGSTRKPTPNSLRSSVAAAIGRGSPPALVRQAKRGVSCRVQVPAG